MEYDEYGNLKNETWYVLDDIESRKISFQDLRQLLEDYGLKNEKNNNKLDSLIRKSISTFMTSNNIDNNYFDNIYNNFFNTYITFENLYNTRVELINEQEISINENDLISAKELIKNGIICCACEIGNYLLNGEVAQVAMGDLNKMTSNPHQNIIHGQPIEYSIAIQFVNSLIKKLNNEFESRYLSKLELIGVLDPYLFKETQGKKYNPQQKIDGYKVASIDNDADKNITDSLEEIGFNNAYFSKKANKRIFEVKNRKLGYISNNTGHWINLVDLTKEENIMNFISVNQIEYNDLILNIEEENVMKRKSNLVK